MPQQYSIADARINLPAIVNKVEAGLKVELTRRGKPVAVVMSVRQFERSQGDRPQFGELYRNFLKRHPLEDVGIDADFAKHIRDKSTGRKVSL